MPRSGGTMSIPNTLVAGETALASDVNENFEDIADELTNSVAVDGQSTLTGQFKAANGTVAAPGITFGADADSGIYRIGANNYGLAANGALVLAIATTGISITGTITPSGQIVGVAGSVSAPGYSFTGDLNSGLYWIGADNLGVSVAGAKVLDIAATGLSITGTVTPSGQIINSSGSVGAPGYSFASDLDSGMYRIGANNVGITLGGNIVQEWLTTGVAITGTLTNSGAVTLQSTLAVTGASTLTGVVTANATAGMTAYNTAKAYGFFSVSGVSIVFTAGTDGFNIATITRTSNGVFAITFTAALPTSNYTVVGNGATEGSGGGAMCIGRASSKLTTGFTLTYRDIGNSLQDVEPGEFVVFGF